MPPCKNLQAASVQAPRMRDPSRRAAERPVTARCGRCLVASAFSIPRTVGEQMGTNIALACESMQALARFCMPGRRLRQSAARRFGVLRMPVQMPPLALQDCACAGTDGRSRPSLVTFFGQEESDPPAGAGPGTAAVGRTPTKSTNECPQRAANGHSLRSVSCVAGGARVH